ncbi:FG-GAP repeat protein [Desulfobulbus sp. F4]|nr:FG-GAP repeat protein [Desulfobulbus sp. F3]MCW5200407.1 FG-GAP repeat protein [Desulfobulbus sp. F4]
MKTLMKHLLYLSALLVLAVSTAYADIDPATAQKLLAHDETPYDGFGWSVAVDGDTAVIGARNIHDKKGAAYVFMRSGNTWTEQAKLIAKNDDGTEDGAAGDYFGYTVAISGNTIVVGALNHADKGAVYVFRPVNDDWAETEQHKLVASDGVAGDNFGIAVSVSGDTALIGANRVETIPEVPDVGAAYIYTRAADGTWSLQQKLIADDGAELDRFGTSVSVSGETALIGAFYASPKASHSGAAYVFSRSGDTWTKMTKIVPDDGQFSDYFGHSVSLSGDTALIGAVYDDDKGSGSGSAYVYTHANGSWSLQQKITADDGMAGDLFGNSVALDGNVALIGARKTDGYDGAAYVFGRSGTSWTKYRKLTAPDLDNEQSGYDYLGWAIALSGDAAFVTANNDDEKGPGAGAAWAFSLVRLALQDALAAVNALDPAVFKKANRQVSLSNQINAALALVEQNLNADALVQAQSILGKTDGCATSGTPDNNDWITDCASQKQVRPFIQEAIVYLNNMMR